MDTRISPSVAHALQSASTDPRDKHRIMAALGWDNSLVSRYLSGRVGLVADKLDAAIAALRFVFVSPKCLNAMATLCKAEANCECTRSGTGECGGGGRADAKRAA
ncbi:hypothetical protein [Paludibacterium yongneupense]|uniref:hypothetical protein n=1 Tax=Paludibacterium yongneupense TaxID=400061 RepID=UPI000686A268|nr:hypothetical protein [Paludibacterium yongneupense]